MIGGLGGLVVTGFGAGVVETAGGAGGAGIGAVDGVVVGAGLSGGGAGMPSPTLGPVMGRPFASTGA